MAVTITGSLPLLNRVVTKTSRMVLIGTGFARDQEVTVTYTRPNGTVYTWTGSITRLLVKDTVGVAKVTAQAPSRVDLDPWTTGPEEVSVTVGPPANPLGQGDVPAAIYDE